MNDPTEIIDVKVSFTFEFEGYIPVHPDQKEFDIEKTRDTLLSELRKKFWEYGIK